MSRRLQILKDSLIKKEKVLASLINRDVQASVATNGQPMNDKKSGGTYFSQKSKREVAIFNQYDEIKKTTNAIEIEKGNIAQEVAGYNRLLPCLQKKVDDGTLKIWRKHPRFLFINGIDKVRIYIHKETLYCKYHTQVRDLEKRKQLIDLFNKLKPQVEKELRSFIPSKKED